MEPPPPPAAVIAAAARDLREISGQIGNIAKASAKRSNLHGLSPVLSNNEIVAQQATAGGKARSISELVHAKPGAPSAVSVPHADQTSLHLYAPEANLAVSDAELLSKTFASGPKLILEGKFGSMEEFIRAASNHTRKATAEARQTLAQNMGSLVPTADTVAAAVPTTQPTKRQRKPGAAAALQEKRKVPTLFYGRYSDAVLALYSPGPAAAAAAAAAAATASAAIGEKDPQEQRKVQKLSHGTRHLYREFGNARVPTQIYAEAIARVAEEIDRTNLSVNNRGVFPEPTKLTWNYVQEMAYVEAKTEEETCRLGSQCVGFDIAMHPKGGCFAFRRWIPPNTQRMHRFCYACILQIVAFGLLVQEASTSNSSGAPRSYMPFLYSCEVPGEYNSKAFLKDKDGVGLTNRVRIFTITDLMPTEDTADGRRRYRERPTLQYFDGSRRLSTLPPINPQSFVDFESKTMTNERMLMVWLFRDVLGKLRDVVKRDLPNWMRVMRLALLPFEEALALLVGLLRSQPPQAEAVEFFDKYMPTDFLDSEDYLYKMMDLYDMAGLDETVAERPKIGQGYFVYFLLHIRINAYLRMLSVDGLELLQTLIINGVAVPGATTEAVDGAIKGAQCREDMPMPDPPKKAVPRPHASCSTQKETIVNEFEAKRIQLETLVRSHRKMMNYIMQQFKTRELRVHDDALLQDEVWAEIKPGEEYLGPFFPEDRRFQEVIREPSLVYQPGPAQRLLCTLRQWCVPVVASPALVQSRDATLAIVHGLYIGEKVVAWIGESPLPVYSQHESPAEEPLPAVTFTPSYAPGSVRFDYELLFGDTRAVWHWVRSQDTTNETLDALLGACNHFVDTWDYGKRYHRRAMDALRQGASVWRKKYSLLASLLIRVHCATVLCEALEGIRNERKRFSAYIEKHEDEKTELFSIIAARLEATNVSIMDYELSPEEEKLTVRKPALENYRKSAKALEEAIYCLKRFINSHLPLAHSMVVNCTDKDGEGPLDSILLDPAVPNCVSVNDDKTARPSLFELLLPENDNVMCEDNLPDCSAFEHQLKFISDSGVHEPILTAQQKTAPVRCHTRDAAKQSSLMAAHNAAFLKYCVSTLYCTMIGYRKSTYRMRFDKNLELYHTFHEHIVSAGPPESRPNYQALLNECKQLSINAIRENTALHISASVGFYMAIKVCFARSGKDYSDFERQWLPNCTNEIRRLYDQGASLQAINATVRETQSRSRSFVYRRTRTDFFRFAWTLLKEVLCKRIVNEFMAGTELEWPNVLTMHRDYTRAILRIVNSLNPHTEDFDYGPTLEEVGCTRENVQIMKRVEARFNTDQSFNMAAAEAEVESLDECQHLVIFAFFNALRAHAAIRVTPLSDRVKEMQIEAVRKRTCSTEPGAGFPAGLCILHLCSVNGCHKRKTPTVQERGLRYIGNSDVSWDSSQQAPVCKPKKTAKGGSSKAARKQRKEKSLSAIRDVVEAEKRQQPTITNSSGKYQTTTSRAGRSKKKAKEAADAGEGKMAIMEDNEYEGGDGEDNDADGSEAGDEDPLVEDFFGDGDEESARIQDAKSIKVALRAYLDEDFYVAETLKAMIKEGVIPAPDDGGKQEFPSGLSKVRKLFDTLQKKRMDLQKAARKEANALVRSLFDMPCEDGVITSHCMLGNVVRRDFIKEKANGEAYTLCPSCGCVSFFRTDMIYSNGFTCGECDARLREDLLRPCCIGCQRMYLTLDRERKIKKPKGAANAQGENATASATAPLVMVVSNGLASLPPTPGTASVASAKNPGRGPKAQASQVVPASVSSQAQPTGGGKRTGVAGGKKAKKRKKSEKHRAIIVKPATTLEEDFAVRARRSGKGPNVMSKLGSDEWFSYNLYDEDIAERRTVYVCGECNYERNFLRSLERMLTVSDFVRIISSGITNFQEAQRLCEVSAKDVTATETNAPAPSSVETTEAKARVEKKLSTKRTKKRSATVMTAGVRRPLGVSKEATAISKEKLVASEKAVTAAMASAGFNMDGKRKKKEGGEKRGRAGILASIKKLSQSAKTVRWVGV